MLTNKSFDNEKYLKNQIESITERASKYDKLYLEFGGKLLWDFHASRVLPGYDPNVKMQLLHSIKDISQVVLCIFAEDIEKRKIRADFQISYEEDTLRLINELRDYELDIAGVIITRYTGQHSADTFKRILEKKGIKVCLHKPIKNYPNDLEEITSENGFLANEYLPTNKKVVVITGPGPGSGKLSTALTLLYHDINNGKKSMYAKFETFPVWNLPLKHPVNIAYESATVDLNDYNCIDPFHLESTGQVSVNYNRDVEAFPILARILKNIGLPEDEIYKSPTQMGVNQIASGIIDDDGVCYASKQEIIRRYFRHLNEFSTGITDRTNLDRISTIMQSVGLNPEDRPVVIHAREKKIENEKLHTGDQKSFVGASIQLKDGTIITGRNSPLLHAMSALVLNAVKQLAGIPDQTHLIQKSILQSISTLKTNVLKRKDASINLSELLIALSVSASQNSDAQKAMEKLADLSGCDVHITTKPTAGDEEGIIKLRLNTTSDPNFATK